MQLSRKQNEYIVNATHRWNIKSGAVRSGKSYVDTAFVIPFRIRERAGQPGLNVILGVSKESIERNVLQPMREIYTDKLIGTINNRNIARVCGEDVYCLGAEKVSQVAKIQGASIKYCYGDEIAKWNKEVFQMLKSRLDKPYSCFDGSCNPENPTHWLKEFLDNEELDIYLQRYTIFSVFDGQGISGSRAGSKNKCRNKYGRDTGKGKFFHEKSCRRYRKVFRGDQKENIRKFFGSGKCNG